MYRMSMTEDERALLLEVSKITYAVGMGVRSGELSGAPLLAAIRKLDPTYDYVPSQECLPIDDTTWWKKIFS